MTTRDQLDAWLAAGAISGAQHAVLDRLVRRDRFSVFVELNALLYLGVLAVAGGLAWTARLYSDQWGDLAILGPATALVAACLYYCVTRAAPYTAARVETASLAFDYVLYLACLVFAVELGYVEYRFHLLQAQWDRYLLLSAFVYFGLAYRFDNRFVLSLALATFGGWFGIRFSRWGLFANESFRLAALVYATVVSTAGVALHRAGMKTHFLETYLHVGANVLLATLVSNSVGFTAKPAWTLGLVIIAGAVVAGGVRFRRFAFVVYGVGYGYLGIAGALLPHMRSASAGLTYVVVSATLMVAGLVAVSRRFGKES
jgi:hypothetical protein